MKQLCESGTFRIHAVDGAHCQSAARGLGFAKAQVCGCAALDWRAVSAKLQALGSRVVANALDELHREGRITDGDLIAALDVSSVTCARRYRIRAHRLTDVRFAALAMHWIGDEVLRRVERRAA